MFQRREGGAAGGVGEGGSLRGGRGGEEGGKESKAELFTFGLLRLLVSRSDARTIRHSASG